MSIKTNKKGVDQYIKKTLRKHLYGEDIIMIHTKYELDPYTRKELEEYLKNKGEILIGRGDKPLDSTIRDLVKLGWNYLRTRYSLMDGKEVRCVGTSKVDFGKIEDKETFNYYYLMYNCKTPYMFLEKMANKIAERYYYAPRCKRNNFDINTGMSLLEFKKSVLRSLLEFLSEKSNRSVNDIKNLLKSYTMYRPFISLR